MQGGGSGKETCIQAINTSVLLLVYVSVLSQISPIVLQNIPIFPTHVARELGGWARGG